MPCETDTHVYVILVDGNVAREGWFDSTELSEARRVAKKYEQNHTVKVKKVRAYVRDLT